MRGYLAWVGAIVIACAPMATPAHAQSANTVKPYIFFIMDVSGSMNDPTNFGLPSCAGATTDTLLTHAKCAFNNIVNSYGDIVMALGRFRQTTADTNPSNGCTMTGVDCDPDNDGDSCEQDPTDCPAGLYGGDRLQVLVPIVDDNQNDLVSWVDFAQNTCGTSNAQDPELFQNGATPLAGSLRGAKLYWQGLSSPTQGPYWTGPGDDPVRDDPLKLVTNPDGTQCRPYITILLTDGEETCAPTFDETTGAATSLLTTVVDGRTYRIETKPIGFGIAPGDAQIEAIAHAGGEPDAAGNQGAYAQNEEELSLEISAIIADAVKFEVCNRADDDCDAEIDEDFPDVGDACDDGELGVCRDTGIFVCNAAGTGVRCDAVDSDPSIPPTDGCNGIDDDCDGVTDEDCVPCGDTELCDGEDNDCDTRVDETLSRPCGTDVGVCVAGTEICRAGDWVDCTATGGAAETCDREDDDCDASTDEQVPGSGDPCTTGAGCPGTRACVNGGMTCVGAPPGTEVCDGIDNNCNGQVDEGTGGGSCGSGCTVGTIVCRDGSLVCEGSSEPGDEICNGRDDDCDVIIDEGVPDGPECAAPGTCGGRERCLNGSMQCVADLPEPEICDCEDGDCDGVSDPDEDPPVCQSGASCIDPSVGPCQCAFPCGDGEFPCSVGQTCDDPDGPGGDRGFCIADPCYTVSCPAGPGGEMQTCVGDAQCVPTCDLRECGSGRRCVPSTGNCVTDNCINFPDNCAANEICVAGACTSNPCAGVTCTGDTYCVNGTCVASCAGVECDDGERCRLGQCEVDPCGGPCPAMEACNETTGRCTACPVCLPGEICDPTTGGCRQDPCTGTTCPGSGQICRDGTCYDAEDLAPDAGTSVQYVSAGGGGGCDAGAGSGAAMALVIAALATRRRRRAGGGAS
jgi:hypothetical protein